MRVAPVLMSLTGGYKMYVTFAEAMEAKRHYTRMTGKPCWVIPTDYGYNKRYNLTFA